ncbi:unnamed protein product [Somion occarium]|uniref:Ubiquitin 3 binding protein But2 C-terminal domain-containing protein n=1 Tax=Somion occarium TaxID=3059160 RepID=A0ABP1DS83_9APHY
MSFEENVEAIPLMHPGEDNAHTSMPKRRGSRSSSNPRGFLAKWTSLPHSALLIALLSLFLSSLGLASSLRSFRQQNELDEAQLELLRKPSLYFGFDKVPRIQQILSLESLIAQAQGTATSSVVTEPTHSLDEDHPTAGHGHGHVATPAAGPGRPVNIARVNSQYPDQIFARDGWVLITEHDRTLLEFRTSSHTSRCVFASYFPTRRSLGDRLLTIELDDPNTPIARIQLTTMTVSESVDFATLTWNTRPQALKLVGELDASFGRNDTTGEFDCEPDTRLLVELACIGRGCRIEYKDETGFPKIGIELVDS